MPTSRSTSDDLEALHLLQKELTDAKTKAGVVIQHRSWRLDEVLRSEDIFSPETPTKKAAHAEPALPRLHSVNTVSSPPKMPSSSSPVKFPPSSSPPIARQKRKLFRSFEEGEPKKRRIFDGNPEENDENGEENQVVNDLGSASVGPLRIEPSANDLNSIDQVVLKDGLFSHEAQSSQSSQSRSPSLPPAPRLFRNQLPRTVWLRTCSGKGLAVPLREKEKILTFEQTIAQRSATAPGRAKKAYYGIDIHQLLDDASNQIQIDQATAEVAASQARSKPIGTSAPIHVGGEKKQAQYQMWTEKYRARKFTDLIGDERTHRSVLRWLKTWDTIVFPAAAKLKPKKSFGDKHSTDERQEQQHRKILLLTGPPGLGKTTLAHVCARQAGYEVLEINASDDRSREVVKGRIKDALGTENVRGIKEHNKARRAGRPVCVIVDEVDGVVTGSGGSGGEGGFMKALIDLVQLDQRSSQGQGVQPNGQKKKGDRFKFLRPLVLICNDVYAASLRPLRKSSVAEIIHIRKPPLDKVISRLRTVFEKEHIPCDSDAVRRLCESTWGVASRKQGGTHGHGTGEGDIRCVLVQGEWIAHKLRATISTPSELRLTRKWIETHIISNGSNPESGPYGVGRGGPREVVERVFLDGVGLPNLPTTLSNEERRLVSESKSTPTGVADLRKRAAINALREMIDTCGDHDRLMTDCFTAYPNQVIQDDTVLSKPNACHEWLHFYDCLSSRVFGGQEWELNPYLSSGVCGFHHLFASVEKGNKIWDDGKHKDEDEDGAHPFSGPKADFAAYEAEKQNRATISEIQLAFSAPLLRIFRSTDAIATELIPNVGRMLAPDVKPVVVGGSGGQMSVASVRKENEKQCINHSVRVMAGLNISFERVRVEIEGGGAHSNGGFVYRMEPPLDTLNTLHVGKSAAGGPPPPVRYAVRQVLDQEHQKQMIRQRSDARLARSSKMTPQIALSSSSNTLQSSNDEDKENAMRPVTGNLKNAPSAAATATMDLAAGVKRDFFGRVIVNNVAIPSSSGSSSSSSAAAQGRGNGSKRQQQKTQSLETSAAENRVWVSFHEGYSNAVRKPITLKELMESF